MNSRTFPPSELTFPAPPSQVMTEEAFVTWCDEDIKAEWRENFPNDYLH